MQLYHSPTSPFVRKCLVAAREAGLDARITLIPAAAHPIARDRELVKHNPLGKIPALVTDDGTVLYDSRVICEYLDELSGGRLMPARTTDRRRALVDQALADGMLDAAVLTRYETAVRPEPLRWPEWILGQMQKVGAGLDDLERRAADIEGRLDIGTIAIGCALGYLDFRYAVLAWRETRPGLAAWFEVFGARPSMAATRPPAGA